MDALIKFKLVDDDFDHFDKALNLAAKRQMGTSTGELVAKICEEWMKFRDVHDDIPYMRKEPTP